MNIQACFSCIFSRMTEIEKARYVQRYAVHSVPFSTTFFHETLETLNGGSWDIQRWPSLQPRLTLTFTKSPCVHSLTFSWSTSVPAMNVSVNSYNDFRNHQEGQLTGTRGQQRLASAAYSYYSIRNGQELFTNDQQYKNYPWKWLYFSRGQVAYRFLMISRMELKIRNTFVDTSYDSFYSFFPFENKCKSNPSERPLNLCFVWIKCLKLKSASLSIFLVGLKEILKGF